MSIIDLRCEGYGDHDVVDVVLKATPLNDVKPARVRP